MSELRAFFERWNNLEADKAALGDDLRVLFAEVKAAGFDAKVARAAFRKRRLMDDDPRGVAAGEELLDLYLADLSPSRARAQARGAREAHDPETGEIQEPGAAASLAAQVPGEVRGEAQARKSQETPAAPPSPSGGGAPFPDLPASLDRRRSAA